MSVRALRVALSVVAGVFLTDAVASRPTSRPASRPAAVKVVKDLAYYSGKDADPKKHRLDLYLPEGRKGAPLLMFVHGGAWKTGDRELYAWLGRAFAGEGVAVAAVSYRLSPEVKHPAHVEDVARAFAFLHGHIAEYGGRPDRMFLMGHSAGGHLVALLALDERYLKAHGLTAQAIRGVIPVSGVYRIMGGERVGMFFEAFGPDVESQRQASPIAHVRKDAPPFLIVYADGDALLLRLQAPNFRRALQEAGAQADLLEASGRTHLTVLTCLRNEDDPVRKAILAFIREHSR